MENKWSYLPITHNVNGEKTSGFRVLESGCNPKLKRVAWVMDEEEAIYLCKLHNKIVDKMNGKTEGLSARRVIEQMDLRRELSSAEKKIQFTQEVGSFKGEE